MVANCWLVLATSCGGHRARPCGPTKNRSNTDGAAQPRRKSLRIFAHLEGNAFDARDHVDSGNHHMLSMNTGVQPPRHGQPPGVPSGGGAGGLSPPLVASPCWGRWGFPFACLLCVFVRHVCILWHLMGAKTWWGRTRLPLPLLPRLVGALVKWEATVRQSFFRCRLGVDRLSRAQWWLRLRGSHPWESARPSP